MAVNTQRLTTKKLMVTCYDATFAKLIADTESFDYVLVGDSVGMVVYGAENTLSVTLETMMRHTEAVRRGLDKSSALKKPILIADMPVGTYENGTAAVLHAKHLLQSGADMVKVEGDVPEVIEELRKEEIRVCGHIGLTPQSIQDYKVQGRTAEDAERLLKEAEHLEAAGAELIVLEMLPVELAKRITTYMTIPTIGIGAGPFCSGQVLVLYDLLGLNPDFKPKFLKRFADGAHQVRDALNAYALEVRSGTYPDSLEHSFNA